ncbi:tudor domain-containing protein 5 isoform X2 [Drosophila kikkawai]|uniref:Tudor domain-containing protein 5 isoform X2 n=1 Tax=Drosophila kikkawai TaxID=30033 RepID=A0A6P4I0N1_DROKI|nr:uncharacterized protein LOC108074727 isoform X2 [Drosophila kikkawai]
METGGKLSYVKKVIHSLVVSCPARMTIEQLSRDYRSEEGCYVPYSALGFRDIESFLRSISDTVVVHGYGPTANVVAVTTAKSAHIQNLVQCQKKPSRRYRDKLKPRFFYQSEQSDLRFINESIRNMKQLQQRQQQQRQQQQPQPQRRYQRPVHQIPVSYPNYSLLNRPPPVLYPNINALICAGQQQQQNVPMFPNIAPLLQSQNLPRSEVRNFQNPQPQANPLPEKPEIKINEVVESFKKLSTTEDTAPTGFIDPLDNEPYISEGDDWVKDDSSSEDGEWSPPPPNDERSELASPIDEAVELELEEVSQSETKRREPLPTIPENIDEAQQQNNPFYESSNEENPDLQPVPSQPQRFMNPFIDYESSDDGSDENAIPADAIDDRVLGVDYPKECVRSDFKLPVLEASAMFEIGQRIEVQLVRVEHPHSFKFWIYNEKYEDYNAMYQNMQFCYENQFPDKYKMPLSLITTDHICAVRSSKSGAWERAQVIRHQPGNSSKIVEVQLVDTGDVMCVSHMYVRHLLKEFATLPAQCLNGRLAYITPWKGPGWSADAVKYFFRLVSFRRLYAKIEDIKDNFACMVLVDPNTTPNLNKALVDSGWVRRCYTT